MATLTIVVSNIGASAPTMIVNASRHTAGSTRPASAEGLLVGGMDTS